MGSGFGVSKDIIIMLVKEITRSKDETIQSKNQTIELLIAKRDAQPSAV